MRNAILYYTAGLLIFYFGNLFFGDEFSELHGDEYAAASLARQEAVTDLRQAGPEEGGKTLEFGYVSEIRVYPGIRLIHSPAAGDRFELSGPVAMLDVLEADWSDRSLTLDFSRPVRTDRYVEVRTDLTAHGSDMMAVNLALVHQNRSELPPRFLTEAPLHIRALSLRNFVQPEPVQVSTQELRLVGDFNLSRIEGRTEVAIYPERADQRLGPAREPWRR
jgi:hypothetical protein